MLVEASKEPMVRCGAKHVFEPSGRKRNVVISVYVVEGVRRADRYEEIASVNDSEKTPCAATANTCRDSGLVLL